MAKTRKKAPARQSPPTPPAVTATPFNRLNLPSIHPERNSAPPQNMDYASGENEEQNVTFEYPGVFVGAPTKEEAYPVSDGENTYVFYRRQWGDEGFCEDVAAMDHSQDRFHTNRRIYHRGQRCIPMFMNLWATSTRVRWFKTVVGSGPARPLVDPENTKPLGLMQIDPLYNFDYTRLTPY